MPQSPEKLWGTSVSLVGASIQIMKRLPQIFIALALVASTSGCTLISAYSAAELATTPTPTPVPTEQFIAAENLAACEDFEYAAGRLMSSVHAVTWTPKGVGDLSTVEKYVDSLEETALGAPEGDIREAMITTVVELPMIEFMGNIAIVGNSEGDTFQININRVGMLCKGQGHDWTLEFVVV